MRLAVLKRVTILALVGAAVFPTHAQDQAKFHIVRTIPLGGEGSWDYLRYDPNENRLFIARSTRVMVVDLAAGKLVGEIPDTAGVHGVALAPGFGRGATSNGNANATSIFDLNSLKLLATVSTEKKPDGILWEPFTNTVLTMNGVSNSISVINIAQAKSIAEIPLPGRPETAVSDGQGKVFVNLEDKAQIAEVNMSRHFVQHTWDLTGCTEPTGLAIDTANARLFSGCHDGVLIVVDMNSGKNIEKLPIGQGVDAVAFDPELHTVFASNKEGTISVINQETANRYRNLETVQTLAGAKTMALDPERHLIYTVANKDGQFVLLEIGR